MRELDETDLEILQLLVSNARRPYSDIGDTVGLSAPAISDRIARLQETGIIRRFTIDIDRSQLRQGIPVLLTLTGEGDYEALVELRESIRSADAVEHVFTTAAGNLVVSAHVPDSDVLGWFDSLVDHRSMAEIEVTLLSAVDWSPDLGGTTFALACAQCGNTVDTEGTAARIGGDLYQFCCPSCEARFTETYQALDQGAD